MYLLLQIFFFLHIDLYYFFLYTCLCKKICNFRKKFQVKVGTMGFRLFEDKRWKLNRHGWIPPTQKGVLIGTCQKMAKSIKVFKRGFFGFWKVLKTVFIQGREFGSRRDENIDKIQIPPTFITQIAI